MSFANTNYNISEINDARIAILAGRWYTECINSLLEKCLAELERNNCPKPAVHFLPGSYEFPLAIRRLLRNDSKIEAVIAFGIVVKGDTDHADMIRDEVRDGFSKVMFEFDVPIIMEVMVVRDIQHAIDRSQDNEKNKGIEAARAALEVIAWRRANSS